MSLNYSQYVTELALLAQFNQSDPNFTSNLPSCLDYAQNRINRELNLLNTVSVTSSITTTASLRLVSLAAINANVLQNINVITPYTTTNPDLGTRNPLVITDKSWLDWTYGTVGNNAQPKYFAMQDNQTILLGPWPDQAYTLEIYGTYWPIGLSAGNPTTFISTYLSDLLLAASMVQMSGYMRNFGSQSDNPAQAVSWETQYVTLRDSAGVEDARRKFSAVGWTSDLPNAYNKPRE
jgi:hypothetical protein